VALGEAYLARGELRTRQGSLSAAIADLNTAANKLRGTSNEALRRRLAQSAFTAARMLEAQHLQGGQDVGDESLAFEIAFDLDSDNATYRSKWAEVSQRIGDEFLADEKYRDAAQAYRRAYDLYPENQTYRDAAVSAYTSYGDEQMDKHDYDKAIEAYQAAHDIGRGDAVRVKLAAAYNARGLIYLAEGKLRRARNDFLRAMRLDPNNSEYQNNYNGIGG
jgi:tetratricopeptide (TPR) repeat protein